MKIIAFEGLDKSGKHTQAKRLEAKLKSLGYKVGYGEYHDYSSPTGKIIRKYLYGEYQFDDLTIELLMVADKQANQLKYKNLESQGYDFLILDRYIGSQICFSRARGTNQEWLNGLIQYLRKPDLEIFLDITVETSISRKGKHGENDRYESNYGLLSKVRNEYKEYFNKKQNKIVLNECDKLSKDKIEEILFDEVKNYIKLA